MICKEPPIIFIVSFATNCKGIALTYNWDLVISCFSLVVSCPLTKWRNHMVFPTKFCL